MHIEKVEKMKLRVVAEVEGIPKGSFIPFCARDENILSLKRELDDSSWTGRTEG